MGRLIIILLLAITTQAQAFDFGLGFGFGSGGSGLPTLPALSAQTLYLPFDGSVGAGTFARTGNAWNPETLAVAGTGVPRYVTGKRGQAIVIETVLTNLAKQSQTFGTTWVQTAVTVSSDAVAAPDGTTTADKVIPTAANTYHIINQLTASTSGVRETHSVYAKAGGYDYIYMVDNNITSAMASFKLTDSSAPTVSGTGSPTATKADVGNGWYRCSLSFTPTATGSAGNEVRVSATGADAGTFLGDGTKGVYLWQADAVISPFTSSPITTTTTTITRNAETLAYPTSGVLTAASGTVAMWVNLDTAITGSGSTFAFFDHRGGGNTGNDNIILYGANNAIAANTTGHTGTSSANTVVGALTGLSGWHHLAMTWDSTKLAVWRDGVELAGSVSSPNIPTTLHTDFKIGYDAAVAAWQPGMPIDNLRVYNRPLIASEMMKLYNLGR